ncbi:glycosyltransferase family 9 protein [Cyclobacteriaceae bacterium]|nr:glycosyltransferase family 9 protein [Cyclobacteriaceae bacterium]
MKKILVVRFSSIGDIVLTTPVVRCLKNQLDNAQIHYVTKPGFRGVLEENPYIDKVHILTESLGELITELKAEKFDYVIDLHSNLRSLVIKKRLGVKSYTFDKLNFKKYLLVNFKINRMPNIHIVDRYMATIEKLGVHNDNKGLDYFYNQKDEVEQGWLPTPFYEAGFSAFAIGGQHATKRLPIDKLLELCAKINGPIVLLGGPEDVEVAQQVEQFFAPGKNVSADLTEGLNKRTVIFNGVGKFNLNQSASIVKQAQRVFTHDTGVMHIAAAFQKEVFSIWGNTVPELGMYPYQTKFTIFEVKDLSCRPCSKIGYDECPKGHFKCMNEQKFDLFINKDSW